MSFLNFCNSPKGFTPLDNRGVFEPLFQGVKPRRERSERSELYISLLQHLQ